MPSEKLKLRLSGFKKKTLTFTSPVVIYSRNMRSKPSGSVRGQKGVKGSKSWSPEVHKSVFLFVYL